MLKKADELSFADIERNIFLLSEKARKGKIVIDDLQGGTFTISNGGDDARHGYGAPAAGGSMGGDRRGISDRDLRTKSDAYRVEDPKLWNSFM